MIKRVYYHFTKNKMLTVFSFAFSFFYHNILHHPSLYTYYIKAIIPILFIENINKLRTET